MVTRSWVSDLSPRDIARRQRRLVSISLLCGVVAGGMTLLAIDHVVPVNGATSHAVASVERGDVRMLQATDRELGALIDQLQRDGRDYDGHRAAAISALRGAQSDIAVAAR